MFESKLKEVKKNQGIAAATMLFSEKSKFLKSQFENRRNIEEMDYDQSRSIISRGLSRMSKRNQNSTNSRGELPSKQFSEDVENDK